jgi:hypothetical protein
MSWSRLLSENHVTRERAARRSEIERGSMSQASNLSNELREPKVHSLFEEIADLVLEQDAFRGISGPWSAVVSKDDYPACAIHFSPHLPMSAGLLPGQEWWYGLEGCAIQIFRFLLFLPDRERTSALADLAERTFESKVFRFVGGLELITICANSHLMEYRGYFMAHLTMDLYRRDGNRPLPKVVWVRDVKQIHMP